jgi:hypothetical protein
MKGEAMQQTYIDGAGKSQADRRQQPHLREIFEDFRARVTPFLSGYSGWGGGELSYLAMRQIQEAYPQLDAQEINVLIKAVIRVAHQDNDKA